MILNPSDFVVGLRDFSNVVCAARANDVFLWRNAALNDAPDAALNAALNDAPDERGARRFASRSSAFQFAPLTKSKEPAQ